MDKYRAFGILFGPTGSTSSYNVHVQLQYCTTAVQYVLLYSIVMYYVLQLYSLYYYEPGSPSLASTIKDIYLIVSPNLQLLSLPQQNYSRRSCTGIRIPYGTVQLYRNAVPVPVPNHGTVPSQVRVDAVLYYQYSCIHSTSRILARILLEFYYHYGSGTGTTVPVDLASYSYTRSSTGSQMQLPVLV